MIWFSIYNHLKDKKSMPKTIKYLIINYLCFVLCKKSKNNHENNINEELVEKNNKKIKFKKDALNLTKNNQENDFEIIKICESPTNEPNESFKKKIKSIRKRSVITLRTHQCESQEHLNNALNKFVFYVFLVFFIFLNIFCLYLLPHFIRKPLSIND